VEQRNKVRGLAHDRNVAKVTLVEVPDKPGVAASVFRPLGDDESVVISRNPRSRTIAVEDPAWLSLARDSRIVKLGPSPRDGRCSGRSCDG